MNTAAVRKKQARRGDLDFLRIVAIIAVVIIHCIAAVVILRPMDSGAWLAGNFIDSFMRWCVPVFVMLSGALILKKQTYSDGEVSRQLKKRLSRIAIPMLAWPTLYVLWALATTDRHIDIGDFLIGYASGAPIVGFHLYFLFLIAGLYILSPIVNMYLSMVTRRQLWITTFIILLVTAIWSTLQHFLPGHSPSLNIITRSFPYVGYFMLGYLIHDFPVKRAYIPVSLFISGCILIAILTYYTNSHIHDLYFYDYPSITVIAISPMAFLTGRIVYDKIASLLSKTHRIKFDQTLFTLSSASFGVYLIHVILLETFVSVLSLHKESIKAALILMPLTIIASWVVTLVMLRVPYVNQLVK